MKRIPIILFLLLSFAGYGQIALTSASHILECVTTSTSNIDYNVEYFDETSSGGGLNSLSVGKIVTATTTTILAAPAASTTRKVIAITLANTGAAENTLTIKVDVSATEYNNLTTITLKPNESLYYNNNVGWSRSPALTTSVSGLTVPFGKTGTASDAAAYWYGYWKDTGVTGAWAPGTPGLAGRATDGTAAADAGCIFFPDAGAGKARYLTEVSINATIASAFSLWDVLWVNSGLVVTTTTAQTVNSVALPARDRDGTTNGEGVYIGIYAVAALGNAGVVSNSTVSYTNSAGTAGRTATLNATVPNNFPATPVIGTVVWFELQAGDTGVRSIQTVTLATTLTSGTASVFMARKLVDLPMSIINTTFSKEINNGLGVTLYDNACILPFARTSATTATVINGSVTTVER
jgi:hypothetical protein